MENKKQIDIEKHIAIIDIKNTLCSMPCDICSMEGKGCINEHISNRLANAGFRRVIKCKDCRHLEIINDGKIYAKCRQTDFEFLPFGTDTRTHFCAFGEMKGAE